jgi:hypothetical protein
MNIGSGDHMYEFLKKLYEDLLEAERIISDNYDEEDNWAGKNLASGLEKLVDMQNTLHLKIEEEGAIDFVKANLAEKIRRLPPIISLGSKKLRCVGRHIPNHNKNRERKGITK